MTSKKNAEYWEGRIADDTWKTYNSLEERNRQLLEMYQEASKDISQELYRITEKVKGGQDITLTDMHKYNRLGELQKNFEGIVKDLGEKTESFVRGNVQDGFKDVYSSTSAAISNEKFTAPNRQLMDEILDRPWLGDSFSSRLWQNTSTLAQTLQDDLVIGLQQGKTIAEISINLANKMQQGFNVAHRLVRTETMHYLNDATLRSYKDRGVTHVQMWTAKDERRCKHCKKYHGKIYPIDKAPVLPIHANCRCTYLPVVDEDEIKKQQGGGGNIGKANSSKGLSAGGNSASKKSIPKFEGKIDTNDAKLVESKIREFEESVVNEPIEHAYVILQNGKIYGFKGSEGNVNPEILGTALNGAKISHNHPINETAWSFSKLDFELFQKYEISEMRGFDAEYEYILNRLGDPVKIEKLSVYEMTEQWYQHQLIFDMAEKEGIHYERVKRK